MRRRWPTWHRTSRCDRTGSTSGRSGSWPASPGSRPWPRCARLDWVLLVALAAGLLHVVRRHRQGREVLSRIAWMVAGCGVAGSALLRAEAVHATQVEALARQGAYVDTRVVVTSDPVLRPRSLRGLRRVPRPHGEHRRSRASSPGACPGARHRRRAVGRPGAGFAAPVARSTAGGTHPRPGRRAQHAGASGGAPPARRPASRSRPPPRLDPGGGVAGTGRAHVPSFPHSSTVTTRGCRRS